MKGFVRNMLLGIFTVIIQSEVVDCVFAEESIPRSLKSTRAQTKATISKIRERSITPQCLASAIISLREITLSIFFTDIGLLRVELKN